MGAGGLASPLPGKLCAIQKGSVQRYGEDGALGNGVSGLYEDRNRNLWVGVRNWLWRWRPGPPKFYEAPGDFITALFIDREGNIWVASSAGLDRFREAAAATLSLSQGKTEAYPLPGTAQQFTTLRLLRDHNGTPPTSRLIPLRGVPSRLPKMVICPLFHRFKPRRVLSQTLPSLSARTD